MSKLKLLIIEDEQRDCENFKDCISRRNDFELIEITDSDIDGLSTVKKKRPDCIVLDIELNNSRSGNANSLSFLTSLKELKLNYSPIIIVTTQIHSKRTYDILHREGADLILYKGHPKYSANYVLNQFVNLSNDLSPSSLEFSLTQSKDIESKISNLINKELDLIGVTSNLVGRQYIHAAILYLIQNGNENKVSIIQHLTNKFKKSNSTITNGIQNAIIHAWRVSSIEDLSTYYTAKVNYETGVPTPMEFLYYYAEKISNQL